MTELGTVALKRTLGTILNKYFVFLERNAFKIIFWPVSTRTYRRENYETIRNILKLLVIVPPCLILKQ